MIASNARHAHLEMGDTPIIDHGAYVMMGNDELFLQMLAANEDFERLRDYVGWTIDSSKALGVKVVNPGGISAFKFNQRSLDVDEKHVHYGITPRDVLKTLTRALTDLRVPHPLHVHASNLGVPGNIESTIRTMDTAEGLPIHLTHIQFHSYGTEGPRKFSSGARAIAEAVNARPNVTIDVGQIIFGQTVTASGDTMMQFKNAPMARPRKWVLGDIECDAGCGVVPFKYREESFVNALQWIIGLEIFLLVDDPWRVSMTTDHPNGAPFTSYPHLIRLLMDKSFRDAQLDTLHADAKTTSALAEITREFSLYEIAIITRAGPAKLLGLKDRGHLGAGAAADIAVYRDDADRERMFTSPAYVFKDGELIARDGTLLATPTGGIHYVSPDYDRAIEKRVRDFAQKNLATRFENIAIGDDEICACCNGGRLLPVACFAASGS
jgi:formylmethanofuran dehydrogenase subunit A